MSNGWPIITDAGGWMRSMEKRTMHGERRNRVINSASDILGPGFAPHAVQVLDWDADEAVFNGFFYSEPSALHSPNVTKYWMGAVIGTDAGFGLQVVWEYRGGAVPPDRFIRVFATIGATRTYTTWNLD